MVWKCLERYTDLENYLTCESSDYHLATILCPIFTSGPLPFVLSHLQPIVILLNRFGYWNLYHRILPHQLSNI